MTPTTARVICPGLPDPLTPGDLQQLFNPSFDERKWAPSVARTPASQVALRVHLKIFQTIGRFLPAADVPLAAVEYMVAAIRFRRCGRFYTNLTDGPISEVLERIDLLYALDVHKHLADISDLILRRYARRLVSRPPSAGAKITEPARTVEMRAFDLVGCAGTNM